MKRPGFGWGVFIFGEEQDGKGLTQRSPCTKNAQGRQRKNTKGTEISEERPASEGVPYRGLSGQPRVCNSVSTRESGRPTTLK